MRLDVGPARSTLKSKSAAIGILRARRSRLGHFFLLILERERVLPGS